MRLVVGRLVALAFLLAAPTASADETSDGAEVEVVELDYHVPAACPDERAFVSAVRARTQRARIVNHAPGSRRLVVDVRRKGGSYAGRLVIEHERDRATREVTSARCDDLVEAFVFFTAIAIDPGASLGASSAAPTPTPPATLPAPTSEPKPAPIPPPPPPPKRRDVVPPERHRAAWHLAIGSGVWAAGGIAESTMLAAHPVVDLGSSATGLSPSLRVGLVWANGPSQRAPIGQLTLGARAVALSGCAYHLRVGGARGVGIRLCAVFEGGFLAVRPFALEYPTAPDRPWLALGPLARVELPILAERLAFGADAGFAVPLERERVYPLGGRTVELVRPIGGRLTATVTVRWF